MECPFVWSHVHFTCNSWKNKAMGKWSGEKPVEGCNTLCVCVCVCVESEEYNDSCRDCNILKAVHCSKVWFQ